MVNIEVKPFSQLIKQYRKEHKLTQTDFGKLINKTQVSVSNYEKDVHFPSDAEEIKAIARILNQPASYILDSIEYSRRGIIEQNEALLLDLEKESNIKTLQQRYKFTLGDQEITEDQLKEALEFIKFKHLMNKQDDSNN